MKIYSVPMVPGPVKLPQAVMDVYQTNFGSADLETEFLELYNQTESNLKRILGTRNRVVIQSGEGMLALWSALKSCLLPKDRVLAVVTGVFGDGIGNMALSTGADVKKIHLPYNETISDLSEIEAAVDRFKPKMITAVHCETPSGTLNPMAELGRLKQRHNVALLYVDAVASAGGAPVLSDDWNIDLCLGASQKCLSSLPDMAFLSVSESAWDVIHKVDYVGYDALKPFLNAQKEHYFPYTPNWHGIAGLHAGAELILNEGLLNSYARHEKVAESCRNKITDMGLSLFPASYAVPSPTVTAVNVPEGTDWQKFNLQLRQKGLAVGGSYGPMAGKVFRLGHMGVQADMGLVEQALNIIEDVVEKI